MAHYYKANPPYYEGVVQLVLSDPSGHHLSMKVWAKFCENKYAKRVLAQYDQEALFKTGEFVQVRKNNRIDLAKQNVSPINHRDLANKHAVILEVNTAPIVRAAKGSRIYKILPVGLVRPVYVHESDLKKGRKGG